jgi:hypothetical protein
MKRLIVIILAVLSACSRTHDSKGSDKDLSITPVVDSINYAEQRMMLSNKLDQLVDSIDQTIGKMEADSTTFDSLRYKNIVNALRYTKDRVERDLEEVTITAINGWNEEYVKRWELNTDKNRRELKKIRSDIAEKE